MPTTPFHRRSFSATGRSRQRGVVLFIALIVLVAMSMAGVALVRSVDTGVLIAGNLTFKQGTTMAGDSGVEAARAALTTIASSGSNALWSDNSGSSYFASLPSGNVDFTGTDPNRTAYAWTSGTNSKSVTPPPTATEVLYVIHRMCAATGDPNTTSCIKGSTAASATSSQAVRDAAGAANFTIANAQYYRITTRVTGPRNTRSFIEVIVN